MSLLSPDIAASVGIDPPGQGVGPLAVHQTIALFLLQPGRGGEQAKALLGAVFASVLHRDRWTGYKHLLTVLHQFC